MVENKKQKCIIIGAGDLSVSEIPSSPEDFIIAVDGGIMYCDVLGLTPNILIGDLDSVDEVYGDRIREMEVTHPEKVIRLYPEKDDTDMLAALRLGLEKGFDTFYLYAACGGRMEHTLANIQCLLYLKKRGAAGYLMEGGGMTFVMKDESVGFRKEMEGYLSVFTLGDKAEGVTIKGMKYSLTEHTLTNDFPIGISNEFTGEEGRIEVKKGELLVILNWG